MNLAHFKKQKEDKKTVTMSHPDGHKITILKSKVSPLQRKQLEKLPLHLAEGDADVGSDNVPTKEEVQSVDATPEQQQAIYGSSRPTLVASNNPTDGLPNSSYGPDSAIKQQVIPADHVNSDNSSATGPTPSAQNINTPAGGSNVEGAYNLGLKAIDEQKNISQTLAKHDADIQQADINAHQQLQENAAQNYQTMKAQHDAFAEYNAAHPIDEKHYVENMGTGQKVATAIGLLLGGFTGGLNKTGVNPAADWLNGQISRDIEGQRARMDQQKTVLGANQQLYQDSLLRDNATRIDMNNLYLRKVQLEASKLGTPQAQQAADALKADYMMKNAAILDQMKIRGSVLQQLHQNGGRGLDPLTLGHPAVGLMSPEQAQKEQASVEKQKGSIAEINDLYAQAAKLGLEAKIPYTEAAAQLANINSRISDVQLRSDKVSRLSPEVQKSFIAPSLVDIGDLARTSKNQGPLAIKKNELLSKMGNAYAGETPYTSRIAPAAVPNWGAVNLAQTPDQRAITWAQQNSRDPRASQILEKNGIIANRSIAR